MNRHICSDAVGNQYAHCEKEIYKQGVEEGEELCVPGLILKLSV